MKNWLLPILLILNTGCVSIGSKTTLTPQPTGGWKEVEHFGEHYFAYECGASWLHIRPTTVKHKITFTGFIVPIIPIMKEWDSSQERPLVLFESKGLNEEHLFASFKINNNPVGFKVHRTQNNISVIEASSDSYHLQSVEAIDLGFNKVSEECDIPQVTFIKQSGAWHEFILSMGP